MAQDTYISLCSGIGGLDLGVAQAIRRMGGHPRCVAMVEREAFAVAVLEARIEEGHLDDAPIWSDLTTFDGKPWRGRVRGIIAGVPCQPFSAAGKRGGTDDKRWLWPDALRIIDEVQPEWFLLENVRGLCSVQGGEPLAQIIGDLVARGFHVEADIFSAKNVGAPHLRERLFLLAVRRLAESHRREQSGQRLIGIRQEGGGEVECRHPAVPSGKNPDGGAVADGPDDAMANGGVHVAQDSSGERRGRWNVFGDSPRGEREIQTQGLRGPLAEVGALGEPERQGPDECPTWPPGPSERDAWLTVLERDWRLAPALPTEPTLRGMVDESTVELVQSIMQYRPHQLRGLGNAVVPTCAAFAFVILWRRAMEAIP